MAYEPPHDLKAVYWRSRRGMQELEVKLIPFLRDRYRALPEHEQRAYDALLAEEDWQLFDWLQDRGEPEFNRRTIYRAQIASLRDSLLDSLDCPSIGLKTPERGVTSTPVQALSLMNNSFVDRQSRKLASRLEAAHPGDGEAQVEEAFDLVMGRPPTVEETRAAMETREAESMVEVCWALFNSTEFIFVR